MIPRPETAEALVLAAHRAFLVQMVGPEIAGVSSTEAAELVRVGFLTEDEAAHGYLVPGIIEPVDPFQLAILMGAIMAGESAEPDTLRKAWADVTKLRATSLRRWIDRVNYRLRQRAKFGRVSGMVRYTAPDWLTPEQAGAWHSARTRAGTYITRIAETARLEVRAMVKEAIAGRLSWPAFAAKLNGRFGSWTRDWRRVARTELQGAYNEGVVATAVSSHGFDSLIARVPEFDACEHCLRLFLDENGRPRIFTARELIANGTNVGRRDYEWRATIWTIHPNCRCDTLHVPPGHAFNSKWRLVPVDRVGKSEIPDLPLLLDRACSHEGCAC